MARVLGADDLTHEVVKELRMHARQEFRRRLPSPEIGPGAVGRR